MNALTDLSFFDLPFRLVQGEPESHAGANAQSTAMFVRGDDTAMNDMVPFDDWLIYHSLSWVNNR